jgi:hypothetical protein
MAVLFELLVEPTLPLSVTVLPFPEPLSRNGAYSHQKKLGLFTKGWGSSAVRSVHRAAIDLFLHKMIY